MPFDKKIKNDWYTYLFQKLIQGLNTGDDLLRIGENKVSFITFNYDRSLEHFLFENLCGLLNHTSIGRQNIFAEFSKIPFIHVYGKIGYLPWEKGIFHQNQKYYLEEGILSYANKNMYPLSVGIEIKKMIEVMFDERKDTSIIKQAQQIIMDADVIFFLGFGYDDINLQILKLPEVLKDKIVYGTCYGYTKEEINYTKSLLKFESLDSKSGLYNYDNLMLMRENLR